METDGHGDRFVMKLFFFFFRVIVDLYAVRIFIFRSGVIISKHDGRVGFVYFFIIDSTLIMSA